MSQTMPNVTPPRPAGAQKPRFTMPQLVIAAVVLVAVLLVAYKLLKHHESHAEHLAVVVTRAIANNDMSPVIGEFNALRRPELRDRAKVGRLSDFVNAKGAFKGVTEDTPAGSPALYHHFIAHFASGDLQERIMLDDDGKIAKFDVRSLDAPGGSQ